MHWRPVETGDLAAINRIGDLVHPPHLHESAAAMLSRIVLGRAHSLVLDGGDEICGYLLAHPWDHSIPKLGADLAAPDDPEILWLHDLALTERCRGHGCAVDALERLKVTGGALFGTIALISASDSGGFWRAQGFRPLVPPSPADLEPYGTGAALMRWDAGTGPLGLTSSIGSGSEALQ